MQSSGLPADTPTSSHDTRSRVFDPRTYVNFRDVADISPDDTCIYFPVIYINSLFDALYFNVRQDRVIEIWVLQAAIKKAQTAVSSGFALITKLVKQIHTHSPDHTVKVKYVLMVPRHDRWKVEWLLGPDFVEGDVFIQFFDTSTEFEHCKPENVVDSDNV